MDRSYDLAVLVLGLAFLGAAILPRLLARTPLSLPMIYVAVGLLLPQVWAGSPRFDPLAHGSLIERITEMAVVVSLMSAGLKLDRRLGWRAWRSTWRLLAVTMPLSIAALALGGWWLLGLPLAAAVLLGAVLAPTDPVLASSVQVGPPGRGEGDEARFALTSEAGLNDGLAFPFVNLAILLAATGLTSAGLTHWLAVDVVWKILAGVGVGAICGHAVAVLVYRLGKPDAIGDGFVVLALTLAAFGGTELAHGYGFIGVFVAALMFRRHEHGHENHRAMNDFSEQIERMLMAVLLILLGASINHGLFVALTWPAALLGAGFLVVVRPLGGWLGLMGSTTRGRQRAAIASLGIRGIGSFYYLSHGLNQADLAEPQARMIWAVTGFIVLASIVLHGVTAPVVMRHVPRAQ